MSTVDWLVDCGIPKIFAISNDIDTENKIMEVSVIVINSGFIKPFPSVLEVSSPAINAPKNTITPYKPGIALRLTIFAPYATENEGPVPLPPIFIAKNIAIRNGISITLNNGISKKLNKFYIYIF